MNYRGSHRKLLGNSKSAMMAAIEIYNKPSFDYRDECVCILLLNAWELLLKALLSKNRESVFYKKKRGEPYRTLSWIDAFGRSEKHFPPSIHFQPIRKNLDLLSTYRDNSVHFYNAKDFGVLLYALLQTSIKNFRDLLEAKFNVRLEKDINWQLLPIGIHPPIDLVTYIAGKSSKPKSIAVRQFLSELARAADEIKTTGTDTGRLLTVFNVKLESVKKIGEADAVVSVSAPDPASAPLAIIRTQDPNASHPLRQMDVIRKIGALNGRPFTSHVFAAISWKYGLKTNPQYCWKATEGVLTRYSNDIVVFVQRLTADDVDAAVTEYSAMMKSRQRKALRAR